MTFIAKFKENEFLLIYDDKCVESFECVKAFGRKIAELERQGHHVLLDNSMINELGR